MLHHGFRTFRLESGMEITPARISWAQYGVAPAAADRVLLLLHGITSSPQAFLGDPAPTPDAGWFEAWTQGVFNLDRDCVLAPNALGSCFGSSGPVGAAAASFPIVTIKDTVAFYAQWLREIGITSLDGVIGYSYGGYQAFQWAVCPPVPTGKVVVLASAPKGNGSDDAVAALRSLAAKLDENDEAAWRAWRMQRIDTLKRYGYADWLLSQGMAVESSLRDAAECWAAEFSAWSLSYLRQAATCFDAREALRDKTNDVGILWMVNRGDVLFPDSNLPFSPPALLQRVAVDGKFGHSSPMLEPQLWMPAVSEFL